MKRFSDLTPAAERIVDAAELLIKSKGYNGFSFEDLARQVGIRKPSIYHHFEAKMELGAIVAQRYTHRFRESLLRIEGATVDAKTRLQAYADLFETTYRTNRSLCICGMLGAEADSLPDEVNIEVRRFFAVNIEWLTMVLSEGIMKGSIRNIASAQDLAESFLDTMEGALITGRTSPDARGPRRAADVILAALSS